MEKRRDETDEEKRARRLAKKAAKREKEVAQLAGYYLLGGPFALVFAFWLWHSSKEGVFFLWGGVALAMLAAATVQLVALWRHDWNRSALEASRRLSRGVDELSAAAAAEGAPDCEHGFDAHEGRLGTGSVNCRVEPLLPQGAPQSD